MCINAKRSIQSIVLTQGIHKREHTRLVSDDPIIIAIVKHDMIMCENLNHMPPKTVDM